MVTRESRFDILRLLSMFMIIVGHLIYHGIRHITSDEMADPGFEHTAIGLTNFCLLQLTGYLCNIGPNLFILISGYFLIHPRPIRYSLEKGFRLWCNIVFYSLLFYGIFIATGLYAYDTETLLRQIMPIHSTSYWFMTMYIGVLLLSPFLARLAQSLSKREYQAMLAVLLIMNFGQENWGYGIVYSSTLFFYVFVFLIGGYIHLHKPQHTLLKYGGAAYLVICIVLSAANCVNQITFHSTAFLQIRGLLNNSFPLFSAICLFLWFYTLPNKETPLSRYAIKTSPYILGVYLIHDNWYVRNYLWDQIVCPLHYLNQWYLIPYILVVCLAILVLCIFIDTLRKKIFPF